MRISDWSSDVCSSDLPPAAPGVIRVRVEHSPSPSMGEGYGALAARARRSWMGVAVRHGGARFKPGRSEEHTSELQSLMRISYAVFCLKKKKTTKHKSEKQLMHNSESRLTLS